MQQIDISSPSSTGNNFTKAIKDFKQLPINYQIDILNSFAQCVEDSKKKNEHDIAVNTCSTEGHVFSKWKKIKYSTKEEYWDAGPRGYVDVEHVEWKRTCTRCGFEERIDYEPQELIEERLEKNKQAKIKRLEKKLEKLKNE
jgi:hypothetical protein